LDVGEHAQTTVGDPAFHEIPDDELLER